MRGNSRASSRGPFIYISRRPDEEEPQINYPPTDSQILKKWARKMAGLFLIGVAIFAGLIVPGFALTKAMILEDPITYGRIWECYRFQFLVVHNYDFYD